MPATVPDVGDQFDDSRAGLWPCPKCGEEYPCPLAAAECHDPPPAWCEC